MVTRKSESDYLKSETSDSQKLGEYADYLYEAKSRRSATNELSILRRCLQIIGKDAEDIGEQDIEALKAHFSDLSERSLETYVGTVRRYVFYCTGRGKEKVKGKITYTREMVRFSEKLKNQGMSSHAASEQVSKVKRAISVLKDNGQPTEPKDITADSFELLDHYLGEATRNEKLGYLRPLGWYVLANTGINPYQEYLVRTSPNKAREIRQCRFETELTDFRDSLLDVDMSEMRRESIIRAARSALNRMDDLIGKDYTLESLRKRDLVRFRRESKDIKESTKREYLQALGMLLEFVTGENLTKECNFRFRKIDEKRVYVSAEDVNRMYRNADSEERLMLDMGIWEAMRRGEIGKMRFSDIKDGNFEFWSKGFGPDGKLSKLPIMDSVSESLREYLEKREKIADKWGDYDPDALFLNSRGMPMSGDVVYSRLKDLAKKSGVKEFTPHSLRRFAATNMRHNGAELGDIAIAMRHEDPVTTVRCYLRDDPELKKATLKMAGKGLLAG